MINIKTRVDIDRSGDDVVPYIAPGGGIVGGGELSGWWEGKGFLHKREISALICTIVDVRHECFVKCEYISVIIEMCDSRSCGKTSEELPVRSEHDIP